MTTSISRNSIFLSALPRFQFPSESAPIEFLAYHAPDNYLSRRTPQGTIWSCSVAEPELRYDTALFDPEN